jgi:hypothetical protein
MTCARHPNVLQQLIVDLGNQVRVDVDVWMSTLGARRMSDHRIPAERRPNPLEKFPPGGAKGG